MHIPDDQLPPLRIQVQRPNALSPDDRLFLAYIAAVMVGYGELYNGDTNYAAKTPHEAAKFMCENYKEQEK